MNQIPLIQEPRLVEKLKRIIGVPTLTLRPPPPASDRSPGVIYGFRYERDEHKVTAEGTLLRQPKGISSFAEDQDGEVYAFTIDGKVYSIRPASN